jgi:multicomponent Na+:H+ antiporter subunit B
VSRRTTPLREREPSHRPVVGIVLCAAVAVVLGAAVLRSPHEHAPLPALARYALSIAMPRWHTTEPVNEIVYGSRGFDTFGETFLLLAAVIGVMVISRPREPRRGFVGEEQAGGEEQEETGRKDEHAASESEARRAERRERSGRWDPPNPDATPLGTPGPETSEAMTVVARTAVRILAPLLIVAGVYLCAWGYSPGGGFPAGAVLLGVALLAYVALGYRRVEPVIRPDVIEPVELAGALAIIAIEAGGLIFKGSFTASFLPLGKLQTIRSGGVLQAFSFSELIEVGTGLTLVVFALLGMGHDWNEEDEEEEEEEEEEHDQESRR